MITVAIIGAGGRMGHALIRSVTRSDGMKLAAAIDQPDHPLIGRDAGLAAGIDELGVAISSDLADLSRADVVVDFTLPAATDANVRAAAAAGKAIVIGTTGLGDAEKAALRDAAAAIPIVWAPNMSLGVNLLFALVKKAASILGMGYRVEIDETHHVHKKDAPSGTALRLGEKVAEGRGQDFKTVMVHDLDESRADYTPDTIVMRSHREGEVVGDHTVGFAEEGETVEFMHHAWSREAFAMGALRAARWVLKKKPGLYDMQDVLDLKGF